MTEDPSGQIDAALREVIEALTTVGTYLAAATRIFEAERRSAHDPLREVLEKSQAQCRRADDALRRLRDLLRPAASGGGA